MPLQWPFFEKCDLDILTLTYDNDFSMYQRKGLTTRNTHVKYESSVTYHLKIMTNVKDF